MPRAVHPQVRPQLEAVVESDEQVLALGLDGLDRRADDPLDLGAGPARPGRGHGPADQVRPEPGGSSEERVALGHRAARLARAAEG